MLNSLQVAVLVVLSVAAVALWRAAAERATRRRNAFFADLIAQFRDVLEPKGYRVVASEPRKFSMAQIVAVFTNDESTFEILWARRDEEIALWRHDAVSGTGRPQTVASVRFPTWGSDADFALALAAMVQAVTAERRAA